jgi:hypothetical protein
LPTLPLTFSATLTESQRVKARAALVAHLIHLLSRQVRPRETGEWPSSLTRESDRPGIKSVPFPPLHSQSLWLNSYVCMHVCLCACWCALCVVCTCVHCVLCVHVCTVLCLCMCTRVCALCVVCVHVYTVLCLCMCTRVCACVHCVCACVHCGGACVHCVCACVHCGGVCMCVCFYAYTRTHRLSWAFSLESSQPARFAKSRFVRSQARGVLL